MNLNLLGDRKRSSWSHLIEEGIESFQLSKTLFSYFENEIKNTFFSCFPYIVSNRDEHGTQPFSSCRNTINRKRMR